MNALIWSLTDPDLPLIVFTIAGLTLVVLWRRLRRA